MKSIEKAKQKTKKFNKNILIYIVLILCILTLAVILIMQSNQTKEDSVVNPYNIEISDMDNFVLLGDSLTEYYPIEEFFDGLPVVNSGVGGYKTTDILNNLEKMVGIYNPTKVFLLIGINDFSDGSGVDKIVNNIKKIIERIQVLRPKTKIYLESIYPINDTDDEKINPESVSDKNNEDIKKINKKLRQYCEHSEVTYIDVYNELIDNEGNLDLKYTEEGLHLSNLGYLKVTKVLLPYFQD